MSTEPSELQINIDESTNEESTDSESPNNSQENSTRDNLIEAQLADLRAKQIALYRAYYDREDECNRQVEDEREAASHKHESGTLCHQQELELSKLRHRHIMALERLRHKHILQEEDNRRKQLINQFHNKMRKMRLTLDLLKIGCMISFIAYVWKKSVPHIPSFENSSRKL